MVAVSGLHVLFWMLLWGALLRTFEMHFHDNADIFGSAARALTVVY